MPVFVAARFRGFSMRRIFASRVRWRDFHRLQRQEEDEKTFFWWKTRRKVPTIFHSFPIPPTHITPKTESKSKTFLGALPQTIRPNKGGRRKKVPRKKNIKIDFDFSLSFFFPPGRGKNTTTTTAEIELFSFFFSLQTAKALHLTPKARRRKCWNITKGVVAREAEKSPWYIQMKCFCWRALFAYFFPFGFRVRSVVWEV